MSRNSSLSFLEISDNNSVREWINLADIMCFYADLALGTRWGFTLSHGRRPRELSYLLYQVLLFLFGILQPPMSHSP